VQELLDAIEDKWTATPALVSAFLGGLHQGHGSETQPDGDYIIYHIIVAPKDQRFGELVPYTAELQFDGFFSDATTAGTKMKLLTDTYENTILSLAGGRINSSVRCEEEPRPMDDLDESSAAVVNWKHWSTSFRWAVV
jgi:hypothetical protein